MKCVSLRVILGPRRALLDPPGPPPGIQGPGFPPHEGLGPPPPRGGPPGGFGGPPPGDDMSFRRGPGGDSGPPPPGGPGGRFGGPPPQRGGYGSSSGECTCMYDVSNGERGGEERRRGGEERRVVVMYIQGRGEKGVGGLLSYSY